MTKLFTNITRICVLFTIIIAMASCGSSSSVVDNGVIQKRKYRKGVHLNIGKKHKVKEQTIPEEVIAERQTEQNISPIRVTSPKPFQRIQDAMLGGDDLVSLKPKGAIKRVIRQKVSPKKEDPLPIIGEAEEPLALEQQRTITGQYQKGGKLALLFSWIFALMPLLIWLVGSMGFPVLQLVIAFFTFVIFLIALILGMRNRQYSSHARKALWLIFLSIIFWAVAYSVLTFVLGLTLI